MTLEKNIGKTQRGTMKVGSKILEILSKRIYTTPWNSLKELVSNSFDADATEVHINYLPEENKLIVKDDGIGMDYKDFDEHFTFIVGSLKRLHGEKTPRFQRPIMGKVGVGFIAISELCDKVKVISGKEDSDTYFVANIDFVRITAKESTGKEFYEVSQYDLTNYEKKDLREHYTIIELINLKETFKDILDNKATPNLSYNVIKSKEYEGIVSEILEKETSNIRSDFGPYWDFLVNFSNVIPIEYLDDGPISFQNKNLSELKNELSKGYIETENVIKKIKSELVRYNFKVYFNGLLLKKFPFHHLELQSWKLKDTTVKNDMFTL